MTNITYDSEFYEKVRKAEIERTKSIIKEFFDYEAHEKQGDERFKLIEDRFKLLESKIQALVQTLYELNLESKDLKTFELILYKKLMENGLIPK